MDHYRTGVVEGMMVVTTGERAAVLTGLMVTVTVTAWTLLQEQLVQQLIGGTIIILMEIITATHKLKVTV